MRVWASYYVTRAIEVKNPEVDGHVTGLCRQSISRRTVCPQAFSSPYFFARDVFRAAPIVTERLQEAIGPSSPGLSFFRPSGARETDCNDQIWGM